MTDCCIDFMKQQRRIKNTNFKKLFQKLIELLNLATKVTVGIWEKITNSYLLHVDNYYQIL